jgi:hypothetical protein
MPYWHGTVFAEPSKQPVVPMCVHRDSAKHFKVKSLTLLTKAMALISAVNTLLVL